MKKIAIVFCLTLCLALAAPVLAADKPSGEISMTTDTIALGIAITKGNGVLTFQGKDYKFKIRGVSILDVGGSTIRAKGKVYNLKDIKDFNGTYTYMSAGGAAVKGKAILDFQNSKNVVLKLVGDQEGLRLTLAPGGMSLTLEE